MRQQILGVAFDGLTLTEAVARIEALITHPGQAPAQVITANPEMVMLARQDPEMAGILAAGELVTPDGIGIVLAARILGCPLPQRVTGIDLAQQLFSLGKYTVYFLGARPGVAEEAAKRLQVVYPGLQVVGWHDGYFQDDQEVIADINRSRPDILLVAMGMGRQEKWFWQHRQSLQVKVGIGVGGCFDVWAGRVKRAPLIFQRLGLEWLYRLLKEPWRYKRMLALPKFLYLAVKERLVRGKAR